MPIRDGLEGYESEVGRARGLALVTDDELDGLRIRLATLEDVVTDLVKRLDSLPDPKAKADAPLP